MKVRLEDFVPYRDSLYWRIHLAYYAQRGARAFTQGDIPLLCTNNYPSAHQQASLALALSRDLEARGLLTDGAPIHLLEVGGGLGTFAERFFRALREGLGEAGRRLSERMVYVYSDYSESTVEKAAAGPELAGLVAAGSVVPACFDARDLDSLRALSGAPLPSRFHMVVSNYLCCVLSTQPVQKRRDGWRQLHIAVTAESEEISNTDTLIERALQDATRQGLLEGMSTEFEWRPFAPEQAFPDARHTRVLEALTDGLEEATVTYPLGYAQLLFDLPARLAPGALILCSDYGSVRREQQRGLRTLVPQLYGNSLNHAVNFAVFDALAEVLGGDTIRTEDPLRSLHVAALGQPGSLTPSLRSAFQTIYVDRRDPQDLLDFSESATLAFERREYATCMRFLQRCLALDPFNADFHFLLGLSAVDGGYPETALPHLLRGKSLDGFGLHDFDFQLGRACTLLGELDDAIEHYRDSLDQDPLPTTWCNLGTVHEALGDIPEARRCYQRALALDPDHADARARLDSL